MKRMKKIDSKVNYKTFHLDPLKEVEKSKHLKGGSDEGTTYEEALVEMGYTLSEETKWVYLYSQYLVVCLTKTSIHHMTPTK